MEKVHFGSSEDAGVEEFASRHESCQDEETKSPLSVIPMTSCYSPVTPTICTVCRLTTQLVKSYETVLSQAESYCEWDEVEADLSMHLLDKPHALALFRSVYRIGVQIPVVLKALAKLCIYHEQETFIEDESLQILAAYFCLPNMVDVTRLACVRLLVVLISPFDAGWQVEEPSMQETLAFIMQANEWEFLRHSEMKLLVQLRANVHIIRRLQQQRQQQGQLIKNTLVQDDGTSFVNDASSVAVYGYGSCHPITSEPDDVSAIMVNALHDDPSFHLYTPNGSKYAPSLFHDHSERSKKNLRELEQRFKCQMSDCLRAVESDGLATSPPSDSSCRQDLTLNCDNDAKAIVGDVGHQISTATSSLGGAFVNSFNTTTSLLSPFDFLTRLKSTPVEKDALPQAEANGFDIWNLRLSEIMPTNAQR
ncbi:hypothetical protein MPSEU_000194200 [Mayamaea pseudoterrestris]|nr:hypothetical protein MPSEU_000194200 [Mayamaea pseudoterrestris]